MLLPDYSIDPPEQSEATPGLWHCTVRKAGVAVSRAVGSTAARALDAGRREINALMDMDDGGEVMPDHFVEIV